MPPRKPLLPVRPAHTVNASCQLGGLRWRVNPNNVSWNYQLDTAVIDTLGGQVVQIIGATLSDLTVSGDLGMDHFGKQASRWRDSWQLANQFQRDIKGKMDAQTSIPFAAGSGTHISAEQTWVHRPWKFTYADDYHTWTFQVLVKGLVDPDDGESAITYSNGKFNYRYQLTMFIVQADSDLVQSIASDAFLSRIAKGVGWNKAHFHGPQTAADAQAVLSGNGGSISGMMEKVLGGQPLTIPSAPATPKPATPATPKK